jgi:hypothetical protein
MVKKEVFEWTRTGQRPHHRISTKTLSTKWLLQKPKSNMIFALSFHQHFITFFEHRTMDGTLLDGFSEQPPVSRLALMHGFQVFTVPAKNKFSLRHARTSTKISIYGLRRNVNG